MAVYEDRHKEWQSGTEGRRCLEWCRVEDGEGVLEIKWGGIELSGIEGNCGWMDGLMSE